MDFKLVSFSVNIYVLQGYCVFLLVDYGYRTEGRLSTPSILLSHKQWSIFNHGSWLCLQYLISEKAELNIHCVNEPEFLSVSYIAIKGDDDDSSVLVEKLLLRSWSAWIFTDRGKPLRHLEKRTIIYKLVLLTEIC